jgi:hypothetical protein
MISGDDADEKGSAIVTPTYEQVASWLDGYFRAVGTYQGRPETVVQLREYFAADLEFRMYTAIGSELMSAPLTREQLLVTFVHPGLVERITPRYYVIDVKAMKAVVQFAIVMYDEESGKEWPVREASAHYHLRSDASGKLEIAKIQYWTELFGPEFRPMFEQWNRARDEALAKTPRQ